MSRGADTLPAMPDATDTDIDAIIPTTDRRGFWPALGELLLVSLGITALAALVAWPLAQALDQRWALVFVYARWLFIFALLLTPVLQQVAGRAGAAWRLPWALRTPATALLLTCESVAFDIISASTH
ncbi:MAG: hypothetical protein JWO69_1181 [Thermoleophilia bacterium]|nr:hypothetical protein [Thermoleophilia bacterium]